MAHKDYTKIKIEESQLLPSVDANTIADMYAQGKSESDVLGYFASKGNRISKNVIDTVFNHIKEVEITFVNMLNGTSVLYQLEPERTIPTTKEEMLSNIMAVLNYDIEKFTCVYDCSLLELSEQIAHVIDNILATQTNPDLKAIKEAITNE